MKIREIKEKKWFKVISNKYMLILILFVVWMIFFDTNSYFIHKELNDDIQALEENKEFYQNEIDSDKAFIEKMSDSFELEKYARERYYLKKENETIYIIEDPDSTNTDQNDE